MGGNATAERPGMAANPATLSPRAMRAIEALLAGASRSTAAAVAGVSERTLRRWACGEVFSAELRQAQARAFDAALGVLRGSALDAVRTLCEVATDSSASSAARVAAARALIEEARKAVEVDELEARIASLEKSFVARMGGRR